MRTSSSAPRASTCWPPAAPLTRSRSPPVAPRRFFVVETLGAATPPDPPRLRPLRRPLPSAVPVPLSVSKQPVRVASIRRPRPGPQGAAAPPPKRAGPAPPLVAAPASGRRRTLAANKRRRPGDHHEAMDASHMDDELRRHFSACCHDTRLRYYAGQIWPP